MPTPSAKLLAVLFAGAVTVAVGAFSACSESDGITPTCTYNIGDAGNIVPLGSGCTQFATCYDDAGTPQAPALCCIDSDGGTLTGSDLANCLYGYGACPNIETDEAGNTTCGAGGGGTGGGSPDGGGPDGGDGG